MKLKSISEIYKLKTNENYEEGDSVSLTNCEVFYTKAPKDVPWKKDGKSGTFKSNYAVMKDGDTDHDKIGISIAGEIDDLKGSVINLSKATLDEYENKDKKWVTMLKINVAGVTVVKAPEKAPVKPTSTTSKKETTKTDSTVWEDKDLRIARQNAARRAIEYCVLTGKTKATVKETIDVAKGYEKYYYEGTQKVEPVVKEAVKKAPPKEAAPKTETKKTPIQEQIDKVVQKLIENEIFADWNIYVAFLAEKGFPKYKEFLNAPTEKKLEVYKLLVNLNK